METGKELSRLHALADHHRQEDGTSRTHQPDQIASPDLHPRRIFRMHLQHIDIHDLENIGPPRLCAAIVMLQDPSGHERKGILLRRRFAGRQIVHPYKMRFPLGERLAMHQRGACVPLRRNRPLQTIRRLQPVIRHSGEHRREPRDLIHDVRRVPIAHRITHASRYLTDDLPVRQDTMRRIDRFSYALNPPFQVREGAVLLQERGAGQDEMGQLGRFTHEQILHHQELD